MTADSATAKRILSTIASVEYLGSPPDISLRLLAKIKDEHSTADDVAGLIMCSPPLSASVLKLCNSAYYGRGQVIDSVSRAVVHLGLKTVARFVYAIDMMGIFTGSSSAPFFNESLFWKSSLAGALLAQEIAASYTNVETDPVFLAALLRDIGVLIVRQYFPDLFSDALTKMRHARIGFGQACSAVCGLDHRSLAFLLAMRWKLPLTIASIFQPPSPDQTRYDGVIVNRNIVLFADNRITMKKVYPWDAFGRPDDTVGASLYLPAETIDAMLLRIVAEVDEFYLHI